MTRSFRAAEWPTIYDSLWQTFLPSPFAVADLSILTTSGESQTQMPLKQGSSHLQTRMSRKCSVSNKTNPPTCKHPAVLQTVSPNRGQSLWWGGFGLVGCSLVFYGFSPCPDLENHHLLKGKCPTRILLGPKLFRARRNDKHRHFGRDGFRDKQEPSLDPSLGQTGRFSLLPQRNRHSGPSVPGTGGVRPWNDYPARAVRKMFMCLVFIVFLPPIVEFSPRSLMFPGASGPGRLFFQTFSGFRARRARETSVNGQRVPNAKAPSKKPREIHRRASARHAGTTSCWWEPKTLPGQRQENNNLLVPEWACIGQSCQTHAATKWRKKVKNCLRDTFRTFFGDFPTRKKPRAHKNIIAPPSPKIPPPPKKRNFADMVTWRFSCRKKA